MKKLFLLILIFNSGIQAFSQKIQIRFVDKFSAPLFGVTVNLRDSLNKSFQLNNFTDTSGRAEFNLKSNSIYLLKASSVGYRPFGAVINTLDKGKAYIFTLQDDSQTLSSVTVSAKKPLMRQEDDKTIVDPEPLAGMSTNAFELIEKTPGLFVDQDGNVYLNSSS
ncbi:MAG: TonB-dependent receptor, partial [Leadbetterella sp.]|nr:TonB-dependent receptor [Leadbetterella sp.]